MDLSTATDAFGTATGPAQGMGLSSVDTGTGMNVYGNATGTLPGSQPIGSADPGAGGFNANNILGFLGKNPGVLLGGAALGADLLLGNQSLPAQSQVQNQATSEQSVGKTLSSYVFSGTLPSGMQDIVNQNTNASIAAIRANNAKLGLSGSTMEAQQIQQVHEAATAQVSQIAEQLLQQGQGWSALSNQEFNQLLTTQMQQDQALQQAIGSFAGGLAGLRTPAPAAA